MARLSVIRYCYRAMSTGLMQMMSRKPQLASVDVGPGVCVKEHRPQMGGGGGGGGGAMQAGEYRLLGGSSCMSPPYRAPKGTLIAKLPYFLCFLAGVLVTGFTMIAFDSVTPCGKSLGDTLLYVVANLTKTTWDTSQSKYKIQCPDHPPFFVGKLPFPLESTPSYNELDTLYGSTFTKDAAIGGHFKPDSCQSTSRVAIIVPYRNRDENLRAFLFYLHQIMQRQMLDYAIFVVEQAGPETTRFNRGVLLNVGFVEAMKAYDFDCVIFYDVDKVPEDDRNSHACPQIGQVRHMAAYQHRFERQQFRDDYFGGVLAMTSHDVKAINGFSNVFFGYGYEDDEFLKRIKLQNLTIYRELMLVTKYWNLGHAGDWTGFDWKYENERLLPSTAERMDYDGLTSVTYDRIEIKKLPIYTRIVVEISENNILANLLNLNRAIFRTVAGALNINADDFEKSASTMTTRLPN